VAANLAGELRILLRAAETSPVWRVQDANRTWEILTALAARPEPERSRVAAADRITPLVELARAEGREAEVVALAEEQVETYAAILGSDELDTARSRLRLANVYKALGKTRQADPLYRLAWPVMNRIFGPETPYTTEVMNDLADCLQIQGRYAEAEPIFREVLRIDRGLHRGPHSDVALDLHNLGLLLWSEAKYDEAKPLQEEALEMARTLWGSEDPTTAAILSQYGMLLRAMGDWNTAEGIYRAVLAVRTKALGPDHPGLISNLVNLAFILEQHGDYSAALDLYNEALRICRRRYGNDHPQAANILNNLGGLYIGQGDPRSAERSYRESLEMQRRVYGAEHPLIALTLNNLADLVRTQGNRDEALRLHRQALALREKLLGKSHPDCAASQTLIGCLDQSAGRYAEAEALLRRALDIRREAFGEAHPWTVGSLMNLGVCLQRQGRLEEAEALLTRAAGGFEVARLNVGRGLGNPQVLLSPYGTLAAVRLRRGEKQPAWAAAERNTGRLLADLLLRANHRDLSAKERAREDSLRTVQGDCERQIAYLRGEARGDSLGSSEAEWRTARERLLRTEAGLAAFHAEVGQRYPVTEGLSFPLDRVQDMLRADRAILGWVEDRSVGPDSTLDMWAYVVRKDGPVQWVRLEEKGSQGDLGGLIQRFRDRLRMPPDPFSRSPETEEAAARLYDRLIAPMLPSLRGIRELVVIPTGTMLGLPLEVLRRADGSPLGDRFSILYSPSSTIHTWIAEGVRRRKAVGRQAVTALVVGDPAYREESTESGISGAYTGPGERLSASRGTLPGPQDRLASRRLRSGDPDALAGLARLRGSRREAEALRRMLGDRARVLLGAEASEQRIVSMLPTLSQYRILHLGTHAFTDDDRPENSGLILSQVGLPDARGAISRNERLFDGRCTASEILADWKLDADLVVLSGCETALGKSAPGEGYIGFSHALFQAGARNLILSLWQVDDESTAILMERFYTHLLGDTERLPGEGNALSGSRIAQALSQAKQDVRQFQDNNGNHPYTEPWYWAGFIQVGGGE
jgi:CHAT domain-containing protein/tetratricopeptide (TPR) repeat protein